MSKITFFIKGHFFMTLPPLLQIVRHNKLVMACGPVDRRADRAEPARAGPYGPYGPARAGSARRGPGFSRSARRAEKKY